MLWASAALGALALLAVVDRGLSAGAARAITAGVAESTCTPASVTTDVQGVPFVTQLVSGRLDRVTITLNDVGRQGVPLDSVVLDVYDVATATPRVADRAELVATMSAADVQAMAGPGWDVAIGDGALVVTGIGSDSSPVQLHLVPRLADGRLHFDVDDVVLFGSPVRGGQVPQELVDAVDRLDRDLRDLPLGLEPTAVQVEDAGLVVRAADTNVQLDGTC